MQQQQINLNDDLGKLRDAGYDLEVDGGHLLVHQIPYVNADKKIKFGTIVTVLTYASPNIIGLPQDHTVYFKGEIPCDHNGEQLSSIINNSTTIQLTEKIVVNHYFSSKPKSGNYPNYFEKIRTYGEILSAQAKALDPSVSAKPGQLLIAESGEDVFNYPDTNSARAKIEFLNRKFRNQKIAIIGMGGTGSYILDLVSKTPVKEIHIYDQDVFQVHNAFRAPGAISKEKLDETEKLYKVDYYHEIYSRLHKGIVVHNYYVTEENIKEFADYDFTFISVDKNKVRSMITNELLLLNTSFIDVGLGVQQIGDSLIGTVRLTLGTAQKNDHLINRIGAAELGENDYASNIQIADLNCLNATLAVIKWKKHLVFYQDLKKEHNSLYFVNTCKIINDDNAT